jgi:hypothetical protein
MIQGPFKDLKKKLLDRFLDESDEESSMNELSNRAIQGESQITQSIPVTDLEKEEDKTQNKDCQEIVSACFMRSQSEQEHDESSSKTISYTNDKRRRNFEYDRFEDNYITKKVKKL